MEKNNTTAKVTEVKAAAKAEETKAAATKPAETAAKAAPAKAEETKTAEKKPAEKKPAAKAAANNTPKKRGPKPGSKKAVKEALKPEVIIQHQGREAALEDAIEKAKGEFVAAGHRVSSIKSLQVYVKPEEEAAYYVINQKFAGRVDLF